MDSAVARLMNGAQIIAANRLTQQLHAQRRPSSEDAGDCPYCAHPMSAHYLFKGNYEDPDPEVDCCAHIHPLVGCVCYGPPTHWTDEQLAQIDRPPDVCPSPPL